MPDGSCGVTVASRLQLALPQVFLDGSEDLLQKGQRARRLPWSHPKINCRSREPGRNKLRRLRGASEGQSKGHLRVQLQGTTVRPFVPTAARRRFFERWSRSITNALCSHTFGPFHCLCFPQLFATRRTFHHLCICRGGTAEMR
jgi:hypothetical protein